MERIAICPGSFDPVTNGHLDIIRRAGGLFDKVIVVVVINPDKSFSFTQEERMGLLRKATRCIDNVEVDSYGGLLVNYVTQRGGVAIVKGLRAVSDFEFEFQMALTNKMLLPDAETIFLTTSTQNMYLSSSIVKQVAKFGGDITPFVPECVLGEIEERLLNK